MQKEYAINEVIKLFDAHIRGAGDPWGVEARVKDYMKEYIEPILTKDSKIFDCGCGDCFTSDYLNGKVRSWTGINKGIDLTNNLEKYNIKEMDFHFLDFEDDSFDICLAVNVLEHSYFPTLLLWQLRRVTKEYVFIDLPMALCDNGNFCHQENPDHHFLMSQFMWEKMFRIIGLEVVKKSI